MRISILSYMITIGHLLLGHHLAKDDASVQEYIARTRMDWDGIWGTEVEICTLAHMLHIHIYSYQVSSANWIKYGPDVLDRSLSADIRDVSMYINTLHAAGRYIGPTERTHCKAKVTFHGGTAAK